MANVTAQQILLDGYRNAVVKCTGVLDTSDVASTVIIDPASFSPTPTQFRIDHIDYAISDQLEVHLFWDANTPVEILPLAGRGKISFWGFGGLQNNGGAGKNGKIRLSTTGWFSGSQTFSIILEMVKQGV